MPSHALKDQFTISIDALQIQYCHPPLTAFNSVQFDLTQLDRYNAEPTYTKGATTLTQLPDDKGNRAYYLHYTVDVNGKHIGTIDVNPVRQTFAAGLVLFTAVNQLLYSNEFLTLIDQFTTDFNLQFHNYSKLDIAVDTTADVMKRFERCFFNANEFHFHNRKQIDKINTFGTIDRNGGTNHTLYLAKDITGRSLKLYNKSIEIVESSHKQYITDYHTANGLDTDKDVWRLELSITNKAIKRYQTVYRLKADATVEPIEYYKYAKLTQTEKALYSAECKHTDNLPIFSKLQDAEHLLSLFDHYTTGLAEFRKKDNNKITRCTRIPLIRLGGNIKPLIVNEYITESKKKEVNTMKHNIKFQFEEFQKWNDMEYLTMAAKIAKRGNLLDYYDALHQQYKPVISAYNNRLLNSNILPPSLF